MSKLTPLEAMDVLDRSDVQLVAPFVRSDEKGFLYCTQTRLRISEITLLSVSRVIELLKKFYPTVVKLNDDGTVKASGFVQITVAFDAPESFTRNRDAEITYSPLGNSSVVQKVNIKGCRTCQKVLSKCKCPEPVVSRLPVYDREVGIYQDVVDKLKLEQN
jgi:hypothetical protein